MSITPWIESSVFVENVDQAVDLYVHEWKLFRIENVWGQGASRQAILRYLDDATPFRLVIVQSPEDCTSGGQVIRAATNSKLSLPKIGFYEWVDSVFKDRSVVSLTPYSANVVLTDPWNHMLTIYTFDE